MSQMTPAQARLIDPLVTELALGYMNSAFVSEALFPRVPVPTRAGYLPQFNNNNWRRFDTTHAPGAKIPEVMVQWSKNPWSLVDRKLNGKIPVETEEEAQAVPGIDMKAESLQLVQDTIANDLEYTAASIARNASNYDSAHKLTLSGSSLWRASTSTPDQDVRNAKHAVRQSIGVNPNVLLLGESVFYALQANVNIQGQFKYTTASSLTVDMLKNYFQVDKVVVGSASYLDDTGVAQDYWGTDAILAYVPQNGAQYKRPSYGYTLYLKGYPHSTQAFYDVTTASWLVPWADAAQPYLTAMQAGFLFVGAGG